MIALTWCSAAGQGTVPGANAPFPRSARIGDACSRSVIVECHIQYHRSPLAKVTNDQPCYLQYKRINGSLRPKSDRLDKLVTPRQMIYQLRRSC